jgi:hypothetical protein
VLDSSRPLVVPRSFTKKVVFTSMHDL